MLNQHTLGKYDLVNKIKIILNEAWPKSITTVCTSESGLTWSSEYKPGDKKVVLTKQMTLVLTLKC